MIYIYGCKTCEFRNEVVLAMSEHEEWKNTLKDMECPECGEKSIIQIIGDVIVHSEEDRYNRKMKKRFKKRNEKIEKMDRPQRDKMTKFIRDHNVKRDW